VTGLAGLPVEWPEIAGGYVRTSSPGWRRTGPEQTE